MIAHLLAWVGLAIVAIANGIVREASYGRHVSELSAHQISTLTGILASGLLVYGLHRVWPLHSFAQAWSIGLLWLIMTIAFEFGFGHFVAGHSWQRLLADYDLSVGRVWSLFVLWILILPALMHWLTHRS